MTEEHSNIQEVDKLLKLANKLDPNPTLELEIVWYMKIKQNGGVQEALKVVIHASRSFRKFCIL